MAQRDRAPVDVHLRRVELQLADARDRLRRERLVKLDQVDLVDGQTSAPEQLLRGRNRPQPHATGIDAADRSRDDPGEWLRPPLTAPYRLCPPHEQQSGRTIVDATRAGRRDRAVLPKRRLE